MTPTLSQPIALIYAGGTFGSYGKPLAPLPAKQFLPILQELLSQNPEHNIATISCLDNPLIKDSSQLDAQDFVHFYQLILTAYASGTKRFVLISGTDTLSYLGAFLAEAFAGSDIKIVVTGSMRPLLDSSNIQSYCVDETSDAWGNLSTALQQASSFDPGVMISFGGETWPAQTVQKIHSHDFMAFTGHFRAAYPANSYVKAIPQARLQHWLEDQQAQLSMIQDRAKDAAIFALYCVPNDPKAMIIQLKAISNHPNCAIILLGFGAGNLPFSAELAAALDDAYQQGQLVIAASQCPFGGVSDSYAAGSWQYDHHVMSGGRLTIAAIYARLLWLLLRFDSPARRRQRWQFSVNQKTATHKNR